MISTNNYQPLQRYTIKATRIMIKINTQECSKNTEHIILNNDVFTQFFNPINDGFNVNYSTLPNYSLLYYNDVGNSDMFKNV